MSSPSLDDLERLANRLAMLASADGEADNAGRAVAQMARRLGLSGGDLKQIFLAGAGRPAPRPAEKGDVATLRREIHELEAALRQAMSERDAAKADLATIKIAAYRQKAVRRSRLAVLAATLPIGVIVFAAVAMFGPDLGVTRAPPVDAPTAAITPSSGVVRSRAALVYGKPDRMSPLIATLPAGTNVTVHRLLWNMMSQWAEIDTAGATGYVIVTDLDLH